VNPKTHDHEIRRQKNYRSFYRMAWYMFRCLEPLDVHHECDVRMDGQTASSWFCACSNFKSSFCCVSQLLCQWHTQGADSTWGADFFHPSRPCLVSNPPGHDSPLSLVHTASALGRLYTYCIVTAFTLKSWCWKCVPFWKLEGWKAFSFRESPWPPDQGSACGHCWGLYP